MKVNAVLMPICFRARQQDHCRIESSQSAQVGGEQDGESDETLRSDVEEALSFIKSSVAKMDRLIGAVLKLAREGQRQFQPQFIDMSQLLRSTLGDYPLLDFWGKRCSKWLRQAGALLVLIFVIGIVDRAEAAVAASESWPLVLTTKTHKPCLAISVGVFHASHNVETPIVSALHDLGGVWAKQIGCRDRESTGGPAWEFYGFCVQRTYLVKRGVHRKLIIGPVEPILATYNPSTGSTDVHDNEATLNWLCCLQNRESMFSFWRRMFNDYMAYMKSRALTRYKLQSIQSMLLARDVCLLTNNEHLFFLNTNHPLSQFLHFVAGLPQGPGEPSNKGSGHGRNERAPVISSRREPPSRIEDYIVTSTILGGICYFAYLAFKRKA